jgi:hypothetical protein
MNVVLARNRNTLDQPVFFRGKRVSGNRKRGHWDLYSIFSGPSFPKRTVFERFDVEADIGLKLTNFRFVRTADLHACRSEGRQSALHVEMYMPQHRSLQGLCRRSVRLAPMSAPARFLLPPQKNTCRHSPAQPPAMGRSRCALHHAGTRLSISLPFHISFIANVARKRPELNRDKTRPSWASIVPPFKDSVVPRVVQVDLFVRKNSSDWPSSNHIRVTYLPSRDRDCLGVNAGFFTSFCAEHSFIGYRVRTRKTLTDFEGGSPSDGVISVHAGLVKYHVAQGL